MILKLLGVGMGGKRMVTFKKFETHYLKAQRRTVPCFIFVKTDYVYVTGLIRVWDGDEYLLLYRFWSWNYQGRKIWT